MSVAKPSIARRLGRMVPVKARLQVQQLWCRAEAVRARRQWTDATATGPLNADMLPVFADRFPVVASAYNYAPDDVLTRGLARYRQLEKELDGVSSTLEIGSADGMTAATLARHGHAATAIDIDVSRTDPRVRAAGVRVIEMDATRLDFPDASFDLVYSFNVFEHLPDPAATLSEVTRVLRPGGVAFISFTGLRWSPTGAHRYKEIGVPYVTVLFEEQDVSDYLRSKGHTAPAPWVNDYSIERFRAAFAAQAGSYSRWRYAEIRNNWHARLIAEQAAVFKARAPSFDSLMVESVRVRGCKQGDARPH